MPYVVSGDYNITDILLHTVFDGRGLSFFVLWIFIESGAVYFLPVFRTGGDDVNAGGIDVAVPQNIRELCNVMFRTVKRAGKEMSQVVGEDLLRGNTRFFA